MALIGKIRNNMWFVLVLLGFALAAFVIMDMTSSSNMAAGASPTLGTVGNQKIMWNEFQTTEKVLYSGAQGDTYQKREGIWNYFIEKLMLENEGAEAGFGVGSEELTELQFGQNLSPIISQRFINPQTGQVDRQQLTQIKSLIDANSLNREAHISWYEIQKEVVKFQLQSKLGNLVSKSIYTPTWMAEVKNAENSGTVDFKFVKIPFDQVANEEVEIADSDIQDYINKNKAFYTTKEEGRIADYIVFDVFPTAEDSASLYSELELIAAEFQGTKDDSIYSINNNGNYTNFYYGADKLGEAIEAQIPNLNIGDVYGPYEDAGNYLAVKLIDKKVVPDSVEARHILRNAAPGNVIALEAANKFIDSLKLLIETGKADFDSLAIKNSNDPVSGSKGGDLGYFAQGAMVPEFNQATFIEGRKNRLTKVITQFGVHLLEVTDMVFENQDSKYKVAFVRIPIVPSNNTQNNVLNTVNDLIAEYRDLNSLKESISSNPDIEIETSSLLRKNDYIFSNLGTGQTSRDIVQWLFSPATETGDVAPNAFTYSDKVNYFDSKYVIVGLSSVHEAGLSTVDALRNDLTPLVMNQKKGEYLAGKISSSDLADIANEYGVEVDSSTNVSLSTPYVPEFGTEPKVIAGAFDTALNSVSSPITGNSGVFIVQPFNKSDAAASVNIPQLKSTVSSQMRNQVSRTLMESLKNMADIEDNRSIFY
jgi:peptidyl-prolyl cis-trans isomerase D